MTSMLINAAILAMLVASLCYGWIITRRVNRLMRVLDGMAPLVREFSAAVDKSERSIDAMKTATLGAATAAVAQPAPAAAPRPNKTTATAAPDAKTPPETPSQPTFVSRRQPVAGITRISGKSELVKGFFERSRRQGGALSQW